MIYAAIFAFALALGACACAVPALIISLRLTAALASLQSRIESSSTKHERRLDEHAAKLSELKSTAPAGLAAQVVELSDAVARLTKTQQRFAGKFYAEGKQRSSTSLDLGTDDEEFLREFEQQMRGATRPPNGST